MGILGKLFGKKQPQEDATIEPDTDPAAAIAAYKRKDFVEALRRADVLVETFPEVMMGWRFRGECLFALQRFREAGRAFTRAEEIGGPGSEELFMWRSMAAHNAGSTQEAVQILRERLASSSPLHSDLKRNAEKLLRSIDDA